MYTYLIDDAPQFASDVQPNQRLELLEGDTAFVSLVVPLKSFQ